MPKHVQVIDGEKFSSHAFYRKQTQRGNVTYIPQSILTNPSTFHRPWISWNTRRLSLAAGFEGIKELAQGAHDVHLGEFLGFSKSTEIYL